MDTFEIIDYNIIGNEVSETLSTGITVELHEDMENMDIIDELINIEYLENSRTDEFTVIGKWSHVLYVETMDDVPICELRNVQE